MGINIHEFKEYKEKYDAVAVMVNVLVDNGIYINKSSHKGLVASGKSISDAMVSGSMPGWLSWKLIKSNIDGCGKLAATHLHANGLV